MLVQLPPCQGTKCTLISHDARENSVSVKRQRDTPRKVPISVGVTQEGRAVGPSCAQPEEDHRSVQGSEPRLEALTADLVGLDDHLHALGGRELAGRLQRVVRRPA